jgi:hypothetical protein
VPETRQSLCIPATLVEQRGGPQQLVEIVVLEPAQHDLTCLAGPAELDQYQHQVLTTLLVRREGLGRATSVELGSFLIAIELSEQAGVVRHELGAAAARGSKRGDHLLRLGHLALTVQHLGEPELEVRVVLPLIECEPESRLGLCERLRVATRVARQCQRTHPQAVPVQLALDVEHLDRAFCESQVDEERGVTDPDLEHRRLLFDGTFVRGDGVSELAARFKYAGFDELWQPLGSR